MTYLKQLRSLHTDKGTIESLVQRLLFIGTVVTPGRVQVSAGGPSRSRATAQRCHNV